MAHRQIVALDDADVRNGLAVLIQRLHGGDDIVHVLLRQLAAVDGEADDIADLRLLLRGFEVVLHGVVAKLCRTDAVAADELDGEALTREALRRALVVEEFIHVDVDAMAACGQDDALDTGLIEALRQIFALLDALVEIVEVLALIQTGSQRHDIAAGHAAVGVVAVAGDLLDLELDADIVFDRAVLVEVREVLPE